MLAHTNLLFIESRIQTIVLVIYGGIHVSVVINLDTVKQRSNRICILFVVLFSTTWAIRAELVDSQIYIDIGGLDQLL